MIYRGSKKEIGHKILPYILSTIPKKKGKGKFIETELNNYTYIEPFMGGANMMVQVPHQMNRLGFDSNQYLIAMFKGLLMGLKPPTNITRERYVEYREKLNEFKRLKCDYSSIINNINNPNNPNNGESMELFKTLFEIGYVGFIWSWSGMFYHPYIGESAPQKVRMQHKSVMLTIQHLRNVTIKCFDCFKLFEYLATTNNLNPKNTIIYCDPPYVNTYGYNSIGKFDFDLFYHYLIRLARQNYRIYISEFYMPEKDFTCIWEGTKRNAFKEEEGKQPNEKLYIPKI
jgi:DNA adenine methylase